MSKKLFNQTEQAALSHNPYIARVSEISFAYTYKF